MNSQLHIPPQSSVGKHNMLGLLKDYPVVCDSQVGSVGGTGMSGRTLPPPSSLLLRLLISPPMLIYPSFTITSDDPPFEPLNVQVCGQLGIIITTTNPQ